ncbi:hypothetical protein Droror1_Dr00017845 [Drosera rotundifolia]
MLSGLAFCISELECDWTIVPVNDMRFVDIANGELSPTHLRLALALNFSVFYYEMLNSPDRACSLAKQVRLMGGKIEILDKDHDERGTCFRFNVFLLHRCLKFRAAHVASNHTAKMLHGRQRCCPCSMEGKDVVPSHGLGRRALSKGSLSFVLIIIETAAGGFSELSRSVAEFRKDLYGNTNASCKVIWLEKPETREHHFRGLNEDNLAETDHIMTMPLQGSRLYQLIRLFPELRGKSMAGGSFT